MGKPKTVQLRLTEQELKLLTKAFGEVNVAVKHVEEHVLPLVGKLAKAVSKFEGD